MLLLLDSIEYLLCCRPDNDNQTSIVVCLHLTSSAVERKLEKHPWNEKEEGWIVTLAVTFHIWEFLARIIYFRSINQQKELR